MNAILSNFSQSLCRVSRDGKLFPISFVSSPKLLVKFPSILMAISNKPLSEKLHLLARQGWLLLLQPLHTSHHPPSKKLTCKEPSAVLDISEILLKSDMNAMLRQSCLNEARGCHKPCSHTSFEIPLLILNF